MINDIEISDLDNVRQSVTFTLLSKNRNLSLRTLATHLRKFLISEIETDAIKTVSIQLNESSLPDELLAQRLGLIPIQRTERTENHLEADEFSLDVVAESHCQIQSSSLKSEKGLLKCVDPDISIVVLQRGQKISLTATTQRGRGSKHAKWSPVSVVAFTMKRGRCEFMLETTGQLDVETLLEMARQRIQEEEEKYKADLN